MSTALAPKVLESCTLIYVEIEENTERLQRSSNCRSRSTDNRNLATGRFKRNCRQTDRSSRSRKLDDSVFRSASELQRQEEILDALDAALQLAPKTIEEKEVFECSIRRVPGSTDWGRAKFREIRQLYELTASIE